MSETCQQAFRSGGGPQHAASLSNAFDALKAAIDQTYEGQPNPRAAAFLSLSSHLADSAIALHEDVRRLGEKPS